jgi:hypothetical protein
MITFQPRYFVLTVALFVVEVLIAVYVHDDIIRPYIGDLLVVILLYCFVRSFLRVSSITAAIAVLLFAWLIEWLQYFKFVKLIGLQHVKLANIVFGNSFAWIDMLAYTAGIILVIGIEKALAHKKPLNSVTTVQVCDATAESS